MMHRPLRIAALVSLPLLVVTVVAWVVSYWSPGYPVPSTAAVHSMLARPLPVVQFDGVELSEILDFLRDITGEQMAVDWPALVATGVRPDVLITLRASGQRFGEVLAGTLSAAGNADYRADRHGIRVSTAAVLRADRGEGASTGEVILGGRRWAVGGERGTLGVVIAPRDPTAVFRLPAAQAQAARADASRVPVYFLGASLRRRGYPYGWWTAEAPFWMLAIVTAVAPALWLRAKARQVRRRRHGQCPRCGYDLRATPGRCPECGADSAAVSDERL